MIKRNEFNKILQLIDAGILSSNNELSNLINSLHPIIDMEVFIYDSSKTGNDSIVIINNTIESNLTSLLNYITEVNDFQDLKLGKNKYQVSWELSFIGLDIIIENTIINSFEFLTNKLVDINSINSFLLKEFDNIKGFINTPTESFKTSSQTNIVFTNPNQNLENYYTKYTQDYPDLVTKTSWNFNYSIKLICNKVV